MARKRKDLPAQSPQEIAELMLGVRGVHLIGLEDGLKVVRAVIETLAEEANCPQCGGVGELYDRPVRELDDAPMFGRAVVFEWHVRRWQCPNHLCDTETWDEELPPVGSAQWPQRPKK